MRPPTRLWKRGREGRAPRAQHVPHLLHPRGHESDPRVRDPFAGPARHGALEQLNNVPLPAERNPPVFGPAEVLYRVCASDCSWLHAPRRASFAKTKRTGLTLIMLDSKALGLHENDICSTI